MKHGSKKKLPLTSSNGAWTSVVENGVQEREFVANPFVRASDSQTLEGDRKSSEEAAPSPLSPCPCEAVMGAHHCKTSALPNDGFLRVDVLHGLVPRVSSEFIEASALIITFWRREKDVRSPQPRCAKERMKRPQNRQRRSARYSKITRSWNSR